MQLETTYICVNDMQKSLHFYQTLLQKEPDYTNDDRWVTFLCGSSISLYNKKYDDLIIEKEADKHFNQAYLDDFQRDDGEAKNNIVIFNFTTKHLAQEYERLKKANLGEMSEMMYVNVHMPYWYFNIKDPDGNVLEITEAFS